MKRIEKLRRHFNANLALQRATPRSLDDVIRLNRDKASLSLTTPAEILKLEQSIEFAEAPKDTFRHWHLVTLYMKPFHKVFVIGEADNAETLKTSSDVRAIDLDKGLVVTRNSLYALDMRSRMAGEPEPLALWHLQNTFWAWGFGEALGLRFQGEGQ